MLASWAPYLQDLFLEHTDEAQIQKLWKYAKPPEKIFLLKSKFLLTGEKYIKKLCVLLNPILQIWN